MATQFPIAPHVIEALVRAALDEDGAGDDITTRALISAEQWGRATFVAKDHGVICGLPVAAAAMTALDPEIAFDTLVADGDRVSAGEELAEVEGPFRSILAAERVALNFLQHLSGVASLTREFVEAVTGTRAQILDTRKTTPGMRQLERFAVRCGGGLNHRFNLASGILIKDNHIAAARQHGIEDLADVIAQARAGAPIGMRIEIEVTTIAEAREAVDGGADIILLDNMSIDDMRAAVEAVAGRAILEASGGVSMSNVRAVAETGVDYISIGRLTHSAPALDISLQAGIA